MSHKTHLGLSEKIMGLRTAAAAMYDKGMAAGVPPEEIQETLKPVSLKLSEMVRRAVHEDVPGVAMAVKRLESLAESHEADAKYLIQKAVDAREHAKMLRGAMLGRMREDGISELHVDDFMVTAQGEHVIFR